jgi:hypothetical protein
LFIFLLKQATIHPEEILKKKDFKSAPFDTTLEILKRRTLNIFGKIVSDPANISFFWPSILDSIPNP